VVLCNIAFIGLFVAQAKVLAGSYDECRRASKGGLDAFIRYTDAEVCQVPGTNCKLLLRPIVLRNILTNYSAALLCKLTIKIGLACT
jgi:hypothetical protein